MPCGFKIPAFSRTQCISVPHTSIVSRVYQSSSHQNHCYSVKRAIINLDHVLYMFFQFQVENTVHVTFKSISVTQIITCKKKKKNNLHHFLWPDCQWLCNEMLGKCFPSDISWPRIRVKLLASKSNSPDKQVNQNLNLHFPYITVL